MRQTNRYSLNRLLHVSSDMDSARLFRRAFFGSSQKTVETWRTIA
ncbi:hypothetical protein DP49_4183 [Burkholderia pseudomallei]|nr:hypothetical protein DP49_4183 [Burkholderia pseudomallei]